MTPDRTAEMQQQDRDVDYANYARRMLDLALAELNRLRAIKGMGPVTLLIPEERQ